MNNAITPRKLELTQEWDKTFPKSDRVNHRKVTFVNRYGITLAADLYEPKNADGKFAAVAVSGPFGADSGGTRFPYDRLRSVVHGRERRHPAPDGFAGYQYRGFSGCG